jgi:hypothetical protein
MLHEWIDFSKVSRVFHILNVRDILDIVDIRDGEVEAQLRAVHVNLKESVSIRRLI